MKTSIRFGEHKDLPKIVNIYNQAIRKGIATGHLNEFELEDRVEWFCNFDKDQYPIYVLEVDAILSGYGTLSAYRPGRKAMNSIAEISFFLDHKYQGHGLGTKLVEYIIKDCSRIGIKTLLAILLDVNERTIILLKKIGFEQWGFFPDVINLRKQSCGQLIYGLRILQIR